MSKNYMKEVAQLLGVELGEKFEIENALCNPCYINENGMYDCDDDCRNNLLVYLLTAQEKLKKSILDDKEREYLASVIAPRGIYENVDYITKGQRGKCFFITIANKKGFQTHLPYFANENMYKGMEIDKTYTLKELGLSKDE